eukprot:365845-Chlamydomonas_euryale.AAC.1
MTHMGAAACPSIVDGLPWGCCLCAPTSCPVNRAAFVNPVWMVCYGVAGKHGGSSHICSCPAEHHAAMRKDEAGHVRGPLPAVTAILLVWSLLARPSRALALELRCRRLWPRRLRRDAERPAVKLSVVAYFHVPGMCFGSAVVEERSVDNRSALQAQTIKIKSRNATPRKPKLQARPPRWYGVRLWPSLALCALLPTQHRRPSCCPLTAHGVHADALCALLPTQHRRPSGCPLTAHGVHAEALCALLPTQHRRPSGCPLTAHGVHAEALCALLPTQHRRPSCCPLTAQGFYADASPAIHNCRSRFIPSLHVLLLTSARPQDFISFPKDLRFTNIFEYGFVMLTLNRTAVTGEHFGVKVSGAVKSTSPVVNVAT